MPILTSLPATHTLTTINFHAAASMSVTQEGILQELGLHEVDELLSKFPKLQLLRFTIRQGDYPHDSDTEWWIDQLYANMPNLPDSVHIAVDLQERYVVTIRIDSILSPQTHAMCSSLIRI